MKLELHVHTNRSLDGDITLEQIEKYLKSSRADYLAISDHDLIVPKILQNHPQIIPGVEFQSDKGEIIGLFITKPIKSKRATKITREIHRQGGLVMIPHPFLYSGANWADLLKEIDLFEVHNPRISRQANLDALEYALNNHLKQIAGSDAHTHNGLGLAYLELFSKEPELNKNQLKQLLKQNKFKISKSDYSPTTLVYQAKSLKSFRQKRWKDFLYYKFRFLAAKIFYLSHNYHFPGFGRDALQVKLDNLYQYGSMWFWRLHHRLRINAIDGLIFKPKDSQKALDVGCNRGFYCQMMTNLGYKTYGIDVSRADLFFAKGAEGKKTIHYREASVEELPFGDSQFDLVLCSEVLEHVAHPQKGLAEIERVLKKDGVAIITMPNLMSYLWLRYYFVYLVGKLWGRDFKELQLHTQWPFWRVKKMIRSAGFNIIKRSGSYLLLGEPVILNLIIKFLPSLAGLLYKLDPIINQNRFLNLFAAFQIFTIKKGKHASTNQL